jgi:hypothetical protein
VADFHRTQGFHFCSDQRACLITKEEISKEKITMSKPVARVVFSLVIALILVVGIYTSVQGAILNSDLSSRGAQASMNAGVKLGVQHDRSSSAQGLNSSEALPADQGDEAVAIMIP